MKRIDY
jgi:hypothetical protein